MAPDCAGPCPLLGPRPRHVILEPAPLPVGPTATTCSPTRIAPIRPDADGRATTGEGCRIMPSPPMPPPRIVPHEDAGGGTSLTLLERAKGRDDDAVAAA